MTLAYVIWNTRPQLVDLGSFEIRYYSLLFALGFVVGYIILTGIFRKQGLKQDLLDRLTIYMVLSTIIGARLGHCLFYEFAYYSKHPLEIILPWRGSIGGDFEFTGFQGLASHGAAIGIIAGLLLFSRKTKSAFLWTMDMVVIVTALAGCFIRLGNLMNSEIYGNPTKTTSGYVFTHDLTRLLNEKYKGTVDRVSFSRPNVEISNPEKGVPIEAHVRFNRKIKDEKQIRLFAENFLPADLKRYTFDGNVLPPDGNLNYTISRDGRYMVLNATITGVPRFPTQIYEAGSYLAIFVILMLLYFGLGTRLQSGYLFGVFLVLVFTARFFIEFLKQNQESFEDAMALNMGQILSIPFVVGGIVLIIAKWPRHAPQPS
jgi:prolipoprotein diacylglyceryl transferase